VADQAIAKRATLWGLETADRRLALISKERVMNAEPEGRRSRPAKVVVK